MKLSVKTLTKIGILSAAAIILMFIEFVIPFMPPFLKIDLSEIPVLFGVFAIHPLAGVLIELIKNLVHILSTQTAGVGELGNFLVGCAFVLPAGYIYLKNKTFKGALWGLIIGTLSLTVVGTAMNYFIMIPWYVNFAGLPLDKIIGMCSGINSMVNDYKTLFFFGIAPFNLIKGIVISIITLLTYKKISFVLHK